MTLTLPLNNQQIQKVLEKHGLHVPFMLYEDMFKLTSIDQLLPQTLLLYEIHQIGHFCCVFLNKEGINFFDSLGGQPDDILANAEPYAVEHKHHDFKYLVQLLLNSPSDCPIIYNDHRLQGHLTNTCGHWCTLRLLWWRLSNEEFYHQVNDLARKSGMNRDEWVAKVFEELEQS